MAEQASEAIKERPSYPIPTPLNIELLRKHLNDDDEMLLTIRTHLYVEALLNAAIPIALRFPNLVDLDRLAFPLKVQLAASMGLIPEWLMRACLCLNRVRNLMAHDVNFTVTEKHKRELWATLHRRAKQHLNPKRRPIIEIPLCEIMKELVISADMSRHSYLTWTQQREAHLEYVKHLIAWIDGKGPKPEEPAHLKAFSAPAA